VGVEQAGVAQVGVAQVGAAQVGVEQVGAAQVGAAQVGAAQVSAAQVGADQVRLLNMRMAKSGTPSPIALRLPITVSAAWMSAVGCLSPAAVWVPSRTNAHSASRTG
jgi:hypothetical protein